MIMKLSYHETTNHHYVWLKTGKLKKRINCDKITYASVKGPALEVPQHLPPWVDVESAL